MGRRRRAVCAITLAGALVAASCGNDQSILNAGNPDVTAAPTLPAQPTVPPSGATGPVDSLAPGETTPPTATLAPGETRPATTVPPATDPPTTLAPSTTVATPLDDLPPCPVGALEAASSPVEITFWHGMSADNEVSLQALADEYNASQARVRVRMENQGGYEPALDKYLLAGQGNRPDMLQSPEYAVQILRDTDSFIPVEACAEAEGYDLSALLPSTTNAYSTGGVLWSMPFNVSNPVLYYNRKMFAAAGLDPDAPPKTLDEIAAYSRQIVDSGAASYGLVVDTDFDGGGGWFIEQWFAKAQAFYADNQNGRSAPATRVLFDGQTGVDIYTFLQQLIATGAGFNVGDNASGLDAFLKLADQSEPGAMTIGTSAALGTVLAAIDSGIAPNVAKEDIGVAPMPGPNGSPTVLVGGASLWIVADKGDAKAAAVWDFIKFLVSAQAQSTWASRTGYAPLRGDATTVDPLATVYRDDPRFAVAYQSLLDTPDEPTAVGPLLGPQREVRSLTALALAQVFNGADPATALAEAAAQANLLLADYSARSG